MQRPKSKVCGVSMSDEQLSAIETMMIQDKKYNRSAFIMEIVMNEWKSREEAAIHLRSKRGFKKEPEPEQPRNIPHPDDVGHAGEMITQDEYDAYMEYRRSRRPLG